MGYSSELSFFGLLGQQDRVATRQAGIWIDFHFSDFIFPVRVFPPNPISITELWNIPRFQCWNILEKPWTMWDSPRPDWNVN